MTSKYTVPTGDGYLGVHKVTERSIDIGVADLPGEWPVGQPVYSLRDVHGVRLAKLATEPIGALARHEVRKGSRTYLPVCGEPIEALGVADGGDVRVYERAPAVLLVDAQDDPFVGGGEDG